MQTTKRRFARALVEEPLDLEEPAPNAMRLIPLKFREAKRAVLEPDGRDTFELAPAPFAITSP
jgi:hypothetical protein